jgi:hypothetical protein
MARVRRDAKTRDREVLSSLKSGRPYCLVRSAQCSATLLALNKGLGSVVVLVRLTLEMDLNAFGQQTTATALTAAGKNRATVFGLHASAKTELLFAGALRGLIGAFHNLKGLEMKEASRKATILS